jgi:hypothetical protein
MGRWICPQTGERHYYRWDYEYGRRLIQRSLQTGETLLEAFGAVRRMEKNIRSRMAPERWEALMKLGRLHQAKIDSHEDELVERVAPHLPMIELAKIWVKVMERLKVAVELGIGGDEARRQYEKALADGKRTLAKVRKMERERPREIIELTGKEEWPR